MSLKSIIRDYSPQKIVSIYRNYISLKSKLKVLFVGNNINYPKVQIYINDDSIETILSTNNFLSYFLPDIDSAGILEVNVYGENGKYLLNKRIFLDEFQSEFINISKEIEKKKSSKQIWNSYNYIFPRTKV